MIVKIKLTKPKDCLSNLELAFAIYTRASFNLHHPIRDAWVENSVLHWRLKRGLRVDEDGMVVSCCLTVENDELSKREKGEDGNGDEE